MTLHLQLQNVILVYFRYHGNPRRGSLYFILSSYIYCEIPEPGHEKTCLMSYANNKGADQPAHPRSLISAFVVRCLDSVMSLVSVTKISSLMLAFVAEHASLSLTWSETPEDTVSHDEAHRYLLCETASDLDLHCLSISSLWDSRH